VPEHTGHPAGGSPALGALLLVVLGAYLAAVTVAAGHGRRWSWWRTGAWCAGLAAAGAAVLGPLPAAAHHDFVAHTAGHLLLGMLSPLLLVLGRPVTVLLRALPVAPARRLSRLLGSTPVRVLTHPVTAAILNAGGLWLLYTSGLYAATRTDEWLHLVVHAHVFLTGYLLTAAVVGGDPAPHRPAFAVRAGALVAFLAAHGILAKHLYAHPPEGVAAGPAETAAMLMYYGGDLIDLVLIVMLCRQRYAATRPGPVVRPRAGVTPALPYPR
jgi:putative membrane protein